MRLDQRSHEMSGSCVFHKIEKCDKLASRKTGRKFIQQQRSAKQKRVVCSAADGSSSAWQQQQYVREKLKRSALVKIPHKDLISFRFCTCGGMSPKWKSYKAGPNVNTNYHTTPETTFRENLMYVQVDTRWQDIVMDMNGDCWFAECFSCPSGLQAGTWVNLNYPSVHSTNTCCSRQSLREQWLFKTAPRKQALSKTSSARDFLADSYTYTQHFDLSSHKVKDRQSSFVER